MMPSDSSPPAADAREAPPNVVKAARAGNIGVLRDWLKIGGQANARETDGETYFTLLTIAATNGHERVVELLLRHGAKINQRSSGGETALMLAAARRHERVATC